MARKMTAHNQKLGLNYITSHGGGFTLIGFNKDPQRPKQTYASGIRSGQPNDSTYVKFLKDAYTTFTGGEDYVYDPNFSPKQLQNKDHPTLMSQCTVAALSWF